MASASTGIEPTSAPNGGSRVLAVTNDRDAALPLLKSVSELIAEYLSAPVPAETF
jgi:hypothetical protein